MSVDRAQSRKLGLDHRRPLRRPDVDRRLGAKYARSQPIGPEGPGQQAIHLVAELIDGQQRPLISTCLDRIYGKWYSVDRRLKLPKSATSCHQSICGVPPDRRPKATFAVDNRLPAQRLTANSPGTPFTGCSEGGPQVYLHGSGTVQPAYFAQADYSPKACMAFCATHPSHRRGGAGGGAITAVKSLTMAEEYLADHFPNFPVMPGVLILRGDDADRRLADPRQPGFRPQHGDAAAGEQREVWTIHRAGATFHRDRGDHLQDDKETTLKAKGTVDGRTCVSGRLVLATQPRPIPIRRGQWPTRRSSRPAADVQAAQPAHFIPSPDTSLNGTRGRCDLKARRRW